MSVSNRINGQPEPFRAVLRFIFLQWKRNPVVLSGVIATMMAATIASLCVPVFAGRLVDAITDNSPAPLENAWIALASIVTLGVLAMIFRFFAFLGITRLTLLVMSRVASEAFARLQRFSTDWHANNFAGSTVRKITRGMWAVDMLTDTLLIALLPSVVILAGTTALLAWRWPAMGGILFVGGIIYVIVTAFLSLRFVAPAARLANTWDTRLGGILADAITCNPVVKAFGRETSEDRRLAKVVHKWRTRTRRTWIRGTCSGSIQETILIALQTAIISLVIWLWSQGHATAGDVTFVLTIYFVVHGYLRDIGYYLQNLQRSVNDMEELVAMYDLPFGVADKAESEPIQVSEGAIAFENVSFHYQGHATPLYRNLSINIKAGEKIGLVGHSGSGKTTFIKLIQRLYDVTGGRITIDGQNISEATQASLRNQIAIVQQEPVLFHRSLAENIAYGRPEASMEEIEHAAYLANAHEFISHLPKGYATLVGERGIKLSGGERQRVALARAFLADAPILILDEATSSLDSESEALIQEAMERLMQDRTTIVIAHRLSTVRAMDRILVFDRGQVMEEGNHETLLSRNQGVYRGLFERQVSELAKGIIA